MDGNNSRLSSTTACVAITTIITTILYAAASTSTTKSNHHDESSDNENVHDEQPLSGDDENGSRRRNPKGTKEGDDSMKDKELIMSSKVVAPFPWEIATCEDDSSDKKSTAETNHESIISNTSNHHTSKSQLDFLASMTFANGGLRSPSCPCCI